MGSSNLQDWILVSARVGSSVCAHCFIDTLFQPRNRERQEISITKTNTTCFFKTPRTKSQRNDEVVGADAARGVLKRAFYSEYPAELLTTQG